MISGNTLRTDTLGHIVFWLLSYDAYRGLEIELRVCRLKSANICSRVCTVTKASSPRPYATTFHYELFAAEKKIYIYITVHLCEKMYVAYYSQEGQEMEIYFVTFVFFFILCNQLGFSFFQSIYISDKRLAANAQISQGFES